MSKRIKILAITRSPVNNKDNLGSTIENIFGDKEKYSLHNIFLRADDSLNNVCDSYFQISEQDIIKSIFFRKECGICFYDTKSNNGSLINNKSISARNREKRLYDFVKGTNLYFPWIVRECVWKYGKWRNDNLKKYLNSIKPDIIFMTSLSCIYPYKILDYIEKNNSIKIVYFHVDDNYSYNTNIFSPFYYCHKYILRKNMIEHISNSKMNYAISPSLKKEYDKQFNIKCAILTKLTDFSCAKEYNNNDKHIIICFTGNISSGRWKTLLLVDRALHTLCDEGLDLELRIYSATKPNKEFMNTINSSKCTSFLGEISGLEVKRVQEEADILLHVESFDCKDISEVKLSFSTKIVDYLSRKRSVIAIGPVNVASIEYFVHNEIGLCITERNSIVTSLRTFLSTRNNLCLNATKCWEKGRQLHDYSIVGKRIYADLTQFLNS